MIFTRKFKVLFLLVIILAFCYRAALLEQRHETFNQELADRAFYTFLMVLSEESSLNAASKLPATNTPPSAASKENIANKYNTLIQGYAGTILRQVEKDCPDEKVLTKIERELAIIELAAQQHSAHSLLKHDIIQDIKKSIALLRIKLNK